MTADDFDARLNALLEMPAGWSLEAVYPVDGLWVCLLEGGKLRCDGAVGRGVATAREAIEAAKSMARERDAKNG